MVIYQVELVIDNRNFDVQLQVGQVYVIKNILVSRDWRGRKHFTDSSTVMFFENPELSVTPVLRELAREPKPKKI